MQIEYGLIVAGEAAAHFTLEFPARKVFFSRFLFGPVEGGQPLCLESVASTTARCPPLLLTVFGRKLRGSTALGCPCSRAAIAALYVVYCACFATDGRPPPPAARIRFREILTQLNVPSRVTFRFRRFDFYSHQEALIERETH